MQSLKSTKFIVLFSEVLFMLAFTISIMTLNFKTEVKWDSF